MIVIGIVSGYTASKLLFAPTHEAGFPETGRYAIGILLVGAVMKLCGVPNEWIEKFLLISGAVGAGVAAARLFR